MPILDNPCNMDTVNAMILFTFSLFRTPIPSIAIPTQAATLNREIVEVFEILGVSYLDAPSTPEELRLCQVNRDQKCLNVYQTLKTAVAKLFDAGRDLALKRTLEGVEHLCQRTEGARDKSTPSNWCGCNGAVSAFYFFRSDQEDRSVADFIEKLPVETLRNLFLNANAFSGDWVHNRPNNVRWLTLLDKLKFLDEDPSGRAGFKALLTSDRKVVSILALIDPERKPDF